MKEGIIQPSTSEHASRVVIVPKQDGEYRVCIDFRELNKLIKRDHFPMPLIEDRTDDLRKAWVFSVIDLKNGFFHVPVAKESQKYTSFVTPEGQYEFLKTPFGLSVSPMSFLRFIDEVFRDLIRSKIVFTYVDDIIIPGENEEEAFDNLVKTLKVAERSGLTVNWRKCKFLKTRIEYLGLEIENGHVFPGTAKIKAVGNFPTPRNKKGIPSFLRLTEYFRKFVYKYTEIARPLSDLIKKEQPFVWGNSQSEAFAKLKQVLSAKPVLRIYNPDAITELHTDASKEGYGPVLLQKNEGEDRFHPVYYYSKKTTDAEKRSHSYELEVLAIISAVKKLRVYLLAIKFKIITDCEAFKKTLSKKDVATKVTRWSLILGEFEYAIEHRNGSRLKHADALSRYPVLVIANQLHAMIKKKQFEDERLHAIRTILQKEPYEDYFVENDIVMKLKDNRKLMVVPNCLQMEIIRGTHENGHFGIKKMKESIETEYYIPRLEEKLKEFVSYCIPCIISNRKGGKKEGELRPLPKGDRPLSTYHIDHVGPMIETRKAYRYIFVVIDSFSKFVWLYPNRTVSAKEVLKKLRAQQEIFGNSGRVISDRGTAFTSGEFQIIVTTKESSAYSLRLGYQGGTVRWSELLER